MKKINLIVLLIITAVSVNAQRIVEKQVSAKSTTDLDLNLEFADSIRIKQSMDNSVHIKATVNINDNQNNDKYELITNENGDNITIKAKIHDMNSIRIPCNNRKGNSYNYDGKCLTMDIYYEIEVPSIANLKIKTISGDIIIEKGIYPMYLESISGFIDLYVPSKADADISVNTVTGGVYSNIDINKSNSNLDSSPGGTDGTIRLNNGGNRIKLHTVSGDIYIRKI